MVTSLLSLATGRTLFQTLVYWEHAVIYVLELPENGAPRAWFAYDDEDFSRKVAASDPLESWEIHDDVTALGLLNDVGHPVADATAREQFPAICALGDEHGWHTPLYRADYVLGRGVFRTAPVEDRAAFSAALAARAGNCCIYWNEREAVGAFEGGDPRIAGKEHWRARHALFEQLVALEVLSDDQ
ncbi:hypothetical protein MIZ03_0736 [Rhodoferax lithotrophicus]|uniref:Uncharacterized protein n=1 Tax=Rhodoferax lithotrophicus TaxID=2798804 RepID=A0ABN6D1I4_9BURK|nr:hypothetical protein MIZ03_0736 [Rhodoferax sp. MIZ03]